MENQEFQKHILERIQKLEDESFGATFEQNYQGTPREQSKDITDDEAKSSSHRKKNQNKFYNKS